MLIKIQENINVGNPCWIFLHPWWAKPRIYQKNLEWTFTLLILKFDIIKQYTNNLCKIEIILRLWLVVFLEGIVSWFETSHWKVLAKIVTDQSEKLQFETIIKNNNNNCKKTSKTNRRHTLVLLWSRHCRMHQCLNIQSSEGKPCSVRCTLSSCMAIWGKTLYINGSQSLGIWILSNRKLFIKFNLFKILPLAVWVPPSSGIGVHKVEVYIVIA